MAKRRRHAAGRVEPGDPSIFQVGVYGLFAAIVAAGVLLAAGNPIWQAVAVLAGAVALLVVLVIVAVRGTPHQAEPPVGPSTGSRHGRRRRR